MCFICCELLEYYSKRDLILFPLNTQNTLFFKWVPILRVKFFMWNLIILFVKFGVFPHET